MPQLSITQLPQAQALTGAESVPVVQNGVTVQTTTSAVAGAGALNYPFLTVSQTAGLTQSRYLGTNSGLTLTDNGAQGTLQINLIGAAQSLNSSGTGIQVKTGANTVTARSIGVGAGLGITNADGVSGNPTVSLGTALQQFVALTGTGMLALQAGSPAKVSILGVTSQTSITNGDGSSDVIVGLADNAVLPGTGSVTLPQGTTGQRLSNLGSIRYNTTSAVFEGYTNTGWNSFSLSGGVTSFSAGTTGFSPNTDTAGAVTLSGVLNVSNGGTGASTLTGYVYGNGTSLMTASTTIPNAGLANSSVTYNGVTVALGASGTITAASPNALTIGTGLTGTSYNGSAAVTIAIDSTVATLTGAQTLTNKTISGASNTLTNVSLTAAVTGTLPVANGGTGRTVGNYSIYANEIHVGKDGNDTTGDGTLINPVLTITKALTLIAAGRNTVVVHPGSYSESPTVSSANTTIETTELTGANTQIAGTLTLSAAVRIGGLKITNLTITGSGNTYISNCTVDTQVVKSGTNYVEIINTELQCVSGVQITGAGIVSIVGNKCWAVAVSNASANVLIKDCFQVLTPSVTAGTLQIDGSAIFAASPASNAVTSSVGSFITLANSFVLNSAGTNVERVSLAGFYSILNLVYDKTNSTFTGTNLNAVDYFSVINTESLVSSGTITAANYVGVAGGVF